MTEFILNQINPFGRCRRACECVMCPVQSAFPAMPFNFICFILHANATNACAEFENAETLLISEVHMLLDHRKKQNESADEEQEFSEVFLKTHTYTDIFRKFKNKETISAVRR